ncbi:thiaminase II [Levilactobacillus acidifarinae]|uniref:Aminopyrimidine aminohydrolase n=1 Tax=Levilactobacillus acidifarinae DSM 19394 = JCM 15949 TaxID=1423715 RepID=A0A0R1LP50_9LACO|nr:thiaminase II [Levilactobacillus acidifarinae]KRK93978.1 transcription activator [Levilactobacillus acidifarinae DSM 19394]GEO68866.1 aminopyrimidine aminohydrolase [Levilactobacillus acidifarinae]
MFTDDAHTAALASWNASKHHPFIQALQAGTLPLSTFRYYLIQDHYYLQEFAKVHELAAQQTTDAAAAAQLRAGAQSLEDGEVANRQTFYHELNITPAEIAATPMAPTNYAYTSHLYRMLVTAGTPGAIAGLLPCYWLYAEIGAQLARSGSPVPIYQTWIDTYTATDYTDAMTAQLALTNRVATPANTPALLAAFQKSSWYELHFWQMALDHEDWRL